MTQPFAPALGVRFGSCLATLPDGDGNIDFTPDFRMATGLDVLAQSLVRRQTTRRGSVITSPNDCLDVRAWLSKAMSDAQIATLSATLRAELLRDQRALAVTVSVVFDSSTGALTITESVTSSAGPFTLTLVLTAGNITVIVNGQ